ncbi:hypothetical protein B0H66DRAFT_80944 [Apodospora peruviana]|uniref:CFEM domain-containing protein n=1 Tax=Apodospora peruviana TaxID=516989 RepID=A0AAE0ITP2_9PEZI|nr:hypothetical protein B0H66DRAFT_80944 [Apodospora peruviana]
MKYQFSLLALAASASATFRHAKPFSCPQNTDNKCTEQQKPGFGFDDLPGGSFSQYKDFVFQGWTAEANAGNRFNRRTGGRAIGGTCSSDKKKSPSFGCGPSVDKFSLGSIHVQPEFDCDLEFHYDMPDGSTCKHRNKCSKAGTTIVNSQCGGAKNVTIVYPPQPEKPKPSCSIVVPTVSFDCSTASSTVPPKTTTTSTTSAVETTTTSEVIESTTSSVLATTSSGVIVSTTKESTTTEVLPSSTPSSVLSSIRFFPNSSTIITSVQTTPSTVETTAQTTESTTTIVTSFQTTSTVFTTSTQTITSCAETITNCPANSVVTTVVTIAVSTTICPVTQTLTSVVGSTTTPVAVETSPVAGGTTTSAQVDTTTSSLAPVETLPCPGVVPSCLNTFLFSTGCSDNSDSACYCPDTIFVKNIFNCLYAHGESDQIISEAVIFFQGICAPYIGSNPGIATDATVTTYITATPTSVAPVVTTVTLDVTTVVPCTDSAGVTIPSSSTTTVVSTTLTVPQVGFTTDTALATGTGTETDDVALIPVTTAIPAVTGGTGNTVGVITPSGTGFFTTAPPASGTGAFTTSALPTGFVTAGGNRAGAGVGAAVAAVAFVAALL